MNAENLIRQYYLAKEEKAPTDIQITLALAPQEVDFKFGVLGMPDRTLKEVLNNDLASTILTIRRVFIPRYVDETTLLENAMVWIKENQNSFRDGKNLPLEVLIYRHTLTLVDALNDGLGSKNVRDLTCPVGFSPNTQSFETDIRSAALEIYQIFSTERGKRPSNIEILSTTKIKYLVRRLYALSDPEDDFFFEGADFLTMIMFEKYFLGLKKRLPLFSP